MIDLTNNIYDYLTVIGLHHKDGRNRLYWLCECECGEQVIRRGDSLKTDNFHSCGCYYKSGVKVDRTGIRYGRLTVIEETDERDSGGSIKWACKCDCGNECIISGNNLEEGTTKSCGCLNDEQRIKQGKSNTGNKNGMFGKTKDMHPNWKGENHRSNNDRVRKSSEYKKWRNLVFERDNYTCQECGKVGHKLNAHHYYSFTEYPEYRFDIENGVTLCEDCHKKVHFTHGKITHGEISKT